MRKPLLGLLLWCAAALATAVDVNTADPSQLESIKGIGPAISARIVVERQKGSFRDWQDFIDRVKGVGDRSAARFSDAGLTVNGVSYAGPVPATPRTGTPPPHAFHARAQDGVRTARVPKPVMPANTAGTAPHEAAARLSGATAAPRKSLVQR